MVRNGTKRMFSCAITTGAAAGIGTTGVAGCTWTTTSGTGRPSLSITVTCTWPAWAKPAKAPSRAARNGAMRMLGLQSAHVDDVAVHGRQPREKPILGGEGDTLVVHRLLQHLDHRVEGGAVDVEGVVRVLHVRALARARAAGHLAELGHELAFQIVLVHVLE